MKKIVAIALALMVTVSVVMAGDYYYEPVRYGTFVGTTMNWTNNIGNCVLKYVVVKPGRTNAAPISVTLINPNMSMVIADLASTNATTANTPLTEVEIPMTQGDYIQIVTSDSVGTNTYMIAIRDRKR